MKAMFQRQSSPLLEKWKSEVGRHVILSLFSPSFQWCEPALTPSSLFPSLLL